MENDISLPKPSIPSDHCCRSYSLGRTKSSNDEDKRIDLSELQDEEERRQVLLTLRADIYAPTTVRAMQAKSKTIRKILSFWGFQELPLTVEKILALSAGLKKGNYRSATSYLELYKGVAERAG